MTISSDALDKLVNGIGQPLTPEVRERVRAAIIDPSVETWDAAHTVLINRDRTLWQAVILQDGNCPTSVNGADTGPARWNGYFPTSFVLVNALRSQHLRLGHLINTPNRRHALWLVTVGGATLRNQDGEYRNALTGEPHPDAPTAYAITELLDAGLITDTGLGFPLDDGQTWTCLGGTPLGISTLDVWDGEVFLQEQFEFELCAECGGDARDHTLTRDPLGHWHAQCAAEPARCASESQDR